MNLKRATLFLALIPLALPTQTQTMPFSEEALAATAVCAGASGIIAIGIYLYRQEIRFQKEQLKNNYTYAINDFCKLVHEPNIFLQAALLETIEPLIPFYKKLIIENNHTPNSLKMNDLTSSVVEKAFEYRDEYVKKYKCVLWDEEKLEKSRHYDQAEMQSFKHEDYLECKRQFDLFNTFYETLEKIDHSSLLNDLMYEIYDELEKKLIDVINKKPQPGRFYNYVQWLYATKRLYERFTLNNDLINSKRDQLIQESNAILETLEATTQYTIEVKQNEISKLESEKQLLYSTIKDLEYDINDKSREISSLKSTIQSLEYEISRLSWRTCPQCHSYV